MSWLSSALGGIGRAVSGLGPLGSLLNFIPGAGAIMPWLQGIGVLTNPRIDNILGLLGSNSQLFNFKGGDLGKLQDWLQTSPDAARLMQGLQNAQLQGQIFGGSTDSIAGLKRFLAEKYKLAEQVDKYDQEAIAAMTGAEMGRGRREAGYAESGYRGDTGLVDTRLYSDMQIPLATANENVNRFKAQLASTKLQRKLGLMPNSQDFATLSAAANAYQSNLIPWMRDRNSDLASIWGTGGTRRYPWDERLPDRTGGENTNSGPGRYQLPVEYNL